MQNKKLQFRKDGTFKILQITDIHGICKQTPDTTKLIEGVLDKEKPDFVVFTGDQIKGYGLSYLIGDKTKKVEQAIDNYILPLQKRGIPFAVTFGNHDPQVGVSLDDQMQMYRAFDNCVVPETDYSLGAGTYSLPVFGSDGKNPTMQFYLIDSGSNAPEGGYASIEPQKIEWYKKIRKKICAENGGYIPSFLFQHIPVEEIYNLYDKVDKKEPGAIHAFRTKKGYYKLKDEFADGETRLHEPSCIPDVNTGLFDAVQEKGDVVAMFFGHDHKNNFVGTYNGVDMGYGPSCGFNEYGNGVERGIRVIEFSENDIRHYKTHVVTYRELFGKRVVRPLQKALYDHIPTSLEAAIPLIVKGVIGIAVVIAAIVLLIKYL